MVKTQVHGGTLLLRATVGYNLLIPMLVLVFLKNIRGFLQIPLPL